MLLFFIVSFKYFPSTEETYMKRTYPFFGFRMAQTTHKLANLGKRKLLQEALSTSKTKYNAENNYKV